MQPGDNGGCLDPPVLKTAQEKRVVRSQIGFSDRLLGTTNPSTRLYVVQTAGLAVKITTIFRYGENENCIERTSYSRYDGHEYKTVYPFQEVNGKFVEHGMAKRYGDNELEREIKYENGKQVF